LFWSQCWRAKDCGKRNVKRFSTLKLRSKVRGKTCLRRCFSTRIYLRRTTEWSAARFSSIDWI
jgi:hypothetical protein